MGCTGSSQVLYKDTGCKGTQHVQTTAETAGHNLVFISFQAVSYPLLEFLGHCRVSRKKEIEQMNNLHIIF